MTGRYPIRYGFQQNSDVQADLPATESTLADELRTVGYKTRLIGKWHLGFTEWYMTPLFRGFDNWYVVVWFTCIGSYHHASLSQKVSGASLESREPQLSNGVPGVVVCGSNSSASYTPNT